MSKISRVAANFLAFALNATAGERTVFGDPATSDTLDANMNADFLLGWEIVGPSEFPTKQDFNAMGFTLGQALAYLHQMGVAEWDINQEYYQGAVVIGSDFKIYSLVAASNTGTNPFTDGPVGTTWVMVGYSRLVEITAGGSYAKPLGLKAVEVEAVAGGGAGGGASAVNDSFGGGGGGGGKAFSIINAVSLAALETVVIGAGGTGSTGVGTDGGDTSFGAHVVATGGIGGTDDSTGTGAVGGPGGTGTSGDSGQDGGYGLHSTFVGKLSGAGGSSGNGGAAGGVRSSDIDGLPGGDFGGGGGGGSRRSSDHSGGNGGNGVVYVREIF